MLKNNANVEINEIFFCYFLLPKSMPDFWSNALALMFMNNSEAFQFFCEHKSHSYRSIADQFITYFCFEQSEMNFFRFEV